MASDYDLKTILENQVKILKNQSLILQKLNRVEVELRRPKNQNLGNNHGL